MPGQLQIPDPLEDLLSRDRDLDAAVTDALRRYEVLLSHPRGMEFFPEYTDHGITHVQDVLTTAYSLISDSAHDLVSPQDAGVLILATLLHDLAMHIGRDGIVRLTGGHFPHQPIPWFAHRYGERAWSEEWRNFAQEATRFSARQNFDLFGDPEPVDLPEFDDSDPGRPEWTRRQNMLVGEFVRRIHGRLAHEIAIYGFPGSNAASHPFFNTDIDSNYTDLAGLVARSHSVPLRDAVDYILESPEYFKNARVVRGVHAPFLMALLRIADYLQVQAARAPNTLLELSSRIRSPISASEWQQHHDVVEIHMSGQDTEAIVINARPNDIASYIGIKNKLRGIQAEIDSSWAVLGEVYSSDQHLSQLGIVLRRVRSNLDDVVSFASSVQYLPEHASFEAADSDLLKLLIGPLYGNSPFVGVRELLQNSVDAVRELADIDKHSPDLHCVSLGDRDRDAPDVFIHLYQDSSGNGVLEVEDYGIGMDADTLRNYFLRAGASFRVSDIWRRLHEEGGVSRVLRSGRFGIGALAAFLLGPRMSVLTRHVRGQSAYSFTAEIDTDPIQIEKVPLGSFHIGTKIVIQLEASVAKRLMANTHGWDWFCLPYPKVQRVVNDRVLDQSLTLPLPGEPDDAWFELATEDYPAVFFSYEDQPLLACNGIHVVPDRSKLGLRNFIESIENGMIKIHPPSMSVFDPNGRLPLVLVRNELAERPSFATDIMKAVVDDTIAGAFALIERFTRSDLPRLAQHRMCNMGLGYPHSGIIPFDSVTPRRTTLWSAVGDGIVLSDPGIIACTNVTHLVLLPRGHMESVSKIPPNVLIMISTSVLRDWDMWSRSCKEGVFGVDRDVSLLNVECVKTSVVSVAQNGETRPVIGRQEDFPISFKPLTKTHDFLWHEDPRAACCSTTGQLDPSSADKGASILVERWQQLVGTAIPTNPEEFSVSLERAAAEIGHLIDRWRKKLQKLASGSDDDFRKWMC